MTRRQSVREFVNRIGTQERVAEMLGVTRSNLKKWVATDRVPTRWVLPFCDITGAWPEEINEFCQKTLHYRGRAVGGAVRSSEAQG